MGMGNLETKLYLTNMKSIFEAILLLLWLTWSPGSSSQSVFVFQLSVIVYLYVGALKAKQALKTAPLFVPLHIWSQNVIRTDWL